MHCVYLKYFSCFKGVKKFWFYVGRCVIAWMSELACEYPCKLNRSCQISQHPCFQLVTLKAFFLLSKVRNILLMKFLHSRNEVSFIKYMINYRHHAHHYASCEQTNHVLYSDPADHFTLLLAVTNVFCLEITIALYEEEMLSLDFS